MAVPFTRQRPSLSIRGFATSSTISRTLRCPAKCSKSISAAGSIETSARQLTPSYRPWIAASPVRSVIWVPGGVEVDPPTSGALYLPIHANVTVRHDNLTRILFAPCLRTHVKACSYHFNMLPAEVCALVAPTSVIVACSPITAQHTQSICEWRCIKNAWRQALSAASK